tara:strand:+ start:156 stop:752 length:597 start_codon:yes stop_codon:yes gene_type:complete
VKNFQQSPYKSKDFYFEIIDDFLPHDKWQENYNLFMTEKIKWTYKSVPQDPSSFFFQYAFTGFYQKQSVDNVSFVSPANNMQEKEMPHYDIAIEPIVKNFKYQKIILARTNLFTRMDKKYSYKSVDGAGLHNDFGYDFKYTTMIYYINTTNGGTYFENGQEVQTKANRLVVFDGHMLHRHIYQTDEKARVATNINIIV